MAVPVLASIALLLVILAIRSLSDVVQDWPSSSRSDIDA